MNHSTNKDESNEGLMETLNSNSRSSANKNKGFSPITSICFTVNYLIGTGFLTLPWAFQQGGILLSTITMIVVVIICNTTKNYVLTAMSFAEALANSDAAQELDGDNNIEDTSFIKLEEAKYGSLNLESPRRRPNNGHDDDSSSIDDDKYLIKDRKFEYIELCRMFLGKFGEQAYVVSVAIAITLQLWGYAAVFGLGLAQSFHMEGKTFDEAYKLFVLCFGTMAVPLSCLELKEQVAFQLLLSFCRFLAMYIMIQTVIGATSCKNEDAIYFTEKSAPSTSSSSSGIKLIDFSGFYEMFSVLVFTAMFHNGIPVLAEPVENRKRLSQNFRNSIVIVSSFCWVLGAVVASYFGDATEQSANLNWESYVGGTGYFDEETGLWTNVALWAQVTAKFIVLFPPINIISAYPLNAIVLANNLLVGACGASAERNFMVKIAFRILASAPPIVGAFFVKELGIITSYAGVLAIVTVLTFPSLLYLESRAEMKRRGLFGPTHYDGWLSSIAGACMVVAFSVVAGFYILLKLLFSR